ncbi:MAG: hypothetical protein QOI63_1616, partial [Thermoplasmata archaeon]|nr:hypothetical protein [Thermoplasmata archaeon]
TLRRHEREKMLAAHRRCTGREAPPKNSMTDALMALEIAMHQVDGNFTALQEAAARRMERYDPHREPDPTIEWGTDGPIRLYDGPPKPNLSLAELADILHREVEFPKKHRIFDWVSQHQPRDTSGTVCGTALPRK